MDEHRAGKVSRRQALKAGIVLTGAAGTLASARAGAAPAGAIKLPPLLGPGERESDTVQAPLPPENRIGFAVVGLGRLALQQILPAFGASKLCRPVALVSGDRAKATTVAAEYGIDAASIYDYRTFDRLADNEKVHVVYVVLPNSMHAEFSVRAMQAGKHVLCEKPMATSAKDCEKMIAVSEKTNRRLMVAYRLQYEPYNREAIRLARAGELGKLKEFSSLNGQMQGDPQQWRLKKALAGGGSLPDVGIYCINAARYLSGEEPTDVFGMLTSTPNDPRFKEVEEQADFTLRFPSGLVASCTSSYGFHDSKRFRLVGTTGWAELDPAFPYQGQSLRIGRHLPSPDAEVAEMRRFEPKNQFALEMDHMATCVRENRKPHTPGEEGLQDQRIIEAIYESARAGRIVKMPKIAKVDAFRGGERAPA
jgi:predicted dehydrogenase